jgi:hypothetical protein
MADVINTSPDGSVQIIFEISYNDVVYRDALYFTSEEYSLLSSSDIDTMKQTRYNAWVQAITPV